MLFYWAGRGYYFACVEGQRTLRPGSETHLYEVQFCSARNERDTALCTTRDNLSLAVKFFVLPLASLLLLPRKEERRTKRTCRRSNACKTCSGTSRELFVGTQHSRSYLCELLVVLLRATLQQLSQTASIKICIFASCRPIERPEHYEPEANTISKKELSSADRFPTSWSKSSFVSPYGWDGANCCIFDTYKRRDSQERCATHRITQGGGKTMARYNLSLCVAYWHCQAFGTDLHMFGSSANGLSLKNSDMDLCLSIDEDAGSMTQIVFALARALRQCKVPTSLALENLSWLQ